MKCNPWRWLWGLIPILVLGWIAILGEREHIEADLTTRTAQVLERGGFGWASVHFEGRDGVISGTANDDSEPSKAIALAMDTLGVRTVDSRVTLADKPESYEWVAQRRDNRIRVNGYVPSDKLRRDVIGTVKANFPSFDVDDRMKLARGAPPVDVWLGGVGFGLKQLALLHEGRVELENTQLSVRGIALDARSYRAVKTALSGKLPQGIRLKNEAVRPPRASPYAWTARRQGNDIVLAGHVPTDAVRDGLMRTARALLPNARVIDRMEPAAGAPPKFVEGATAALQQLVVLDDSTARLRDKEFSLAGVADTSERADQVRSALKHGAFAAFEVNSDIQLRARELKTITPYRTAVSLEAGRLTLRGFAPDDRAHAGLLTAARRQFEGVAVADELQIGAGEPPGWAKCLGVALSTLKQLGNGTATLSDSRLSVAGTTAAEAVAQQLPAEARVDAGSACDVSVRVTLDVAALQAADEERRRAEAAARQQAADEERHRAEAAARQQAADEERHRAEAAARQQAADEERRRAEAAARQQAADEERRRAEAAARQQAADEERHRAEAAARQQAAEAERRRAEAVARRKADAERIAKLPAEEKKKVVDVCQEALARVVHEGIINFNRASYDLDPASYPTLNKVADAANRCPALTVEIEGHTDSEGTPERNQRLSIRRADSVREYLSRAGVEPSRLEALGFGQSRPIASNDTAAGRAMNRRIEFTVKLKE